MRKKMLITGTTSGVGLEILKEYATEYEVISLSRTPLPKEIEGIEEYLIDLTDLVALEKVLEGIFKKHKYIPIVINNAGLMLKKPTLELSIQELEESLKVNAYAPFLIMKHALKEMINHDYGRIINLTSGAPFNCFQEFAAYSGSKGLLNTLTRTLANEYKNYDIKINLLSPGPCKTKMAPDGTLPPTAPLPTIDYLLKQNKLDMTGGFYWLGYRLPLTPNHEGVEWLKGKASERFEYVL